MTLAIQKLEVVQRRWDALLEGSKLDTIRFGETRIENGFLLYECIPCANKYCVVFVTQTLDIPLRDVLKYTLDTKRKPDEKTLLKRMKIHYPEITLETKVQYIQHLSVDETLKCYPHDVKHILELAYTDLNSRAR